MGRFLKNAKCKMQNAKLKRAKVSFAEFAQYVAEQTEREAEIAGRVAVLEEKAKERDGLEVRVRELEERCKKLELDLFEEKNSREASVTSSQLLTEYIHGEEGSDYD